MSWQNTVPTISVTFLFNTYLELNHTETLNKAKLRLFYKNAYSVAFKGKKVHEKLRRSKNESSPREATGDN